MRTPGNLDDCGGGSGPLAVPDGAIAFADAGALTGDLAVAQVTNAGFPVRAVQFTNVEVAGQYPNGGLSAGSCVFGFDVFCGGAFNIHGSTSPAALPAGDTNDWGAAGEFGPPPYQFARLNVTAIAGARLTGIDAAAASWPFNGGNLDGFLLFLINVGANSYTLKHNSLLSTLADRFKLPGAVDLVMSQFQGLWLMYNGNLQAWTKAA